MLPESDKWGWKHVTVFGGFDKGSGTKRWKCNHCNLRYNGSYSRVRAHLLGFSGVGVKGCPAIDGSVREAFQVFEEERLARRSKRVPRTDKPVKRIRTTKPGITVSKEEVDGVVARFLYASSLDLNVVNSPYFREMTKAIASYGHRYESPAVADLSGSYLSKEKARIEKSVAPVRESWLHTGCSVLCVGRSDSRLGFFQVDIFVSCPRGLVFLKAVNLGDDDVAESRFSDVLVDVITDIGSVNVLQIISHFDRANQLLGSPAFSNFPHIFMSPCTSHSLCMLMEEIAEIDSIKAVLTSAKRIDQCLIDFQEFCPVTFSPIIMENPNQTASKFALFFAMVQRLLQLKQPLKDAVTSNEWKLNTTRDTAETEIAILEDSFWDEAEYLVQLFEPFVRLLTTLDINGFFMGDICNWRVQAFEELRNKGPVGVRSNQLEELFTKRWDALFSPLHAAGYILNPRYFGKGQAKDKIVMKGWKSTLERYERESTVRQTLREQLSSYWRLEGSLGDEDAVHCRDKMDPVAWWENFGSETPLLQTLAIKVLSQVSSVAPCKGICRDDRMKCGEAAGRSGVERVEDLVFVQNNLRIHTQRNGAT